jgi:hypothetical protein
MKTKHLLYLIIVLLLIGCTPKEKELTGEVFIMTEGGQNIKLNLVEISVIAFDEMNPFAQNKIQSAKQEIDRLKPKIQKAQKEYKKMLQSKEKFYRVYLDNIYSHRYKKKYDDLLKAISKKRIEINQLLTSYNRYSQETYFFDGLPEPIQSTKTDANGKFNFKLKPAKYAIVAFSSRKTGGSDKDYSWFLWVSTEKDSQQNILLSNDKLFGSECESCIFKISQLSF